MAYSNNYSYLLISTGNKSEMSVGYSTIYGDMNGGFNVLKDVYKTELYKLANWRNNLNKKLEIEGVLITMYDSRLNLSNQVVNEVKQYFGEKVYKTLIHRNVKLSESPSFGKPIMLYDASSTGSQNYMNLATEVLIRNE